MRTRRFAAEPEYVLFHDNAGKRITIPVEFKTSAEADRFIRNYEHTGGIKMFEADVYGPDKEAFIKWAKIRESEIVTGMSRDKLFEMLWNKFIGWDKTASEKNIISRKLSKYTKYFHYKEGDECPVCEDAGRISKLKWKGKELVCPKCNELLGKKASAGEHIASELCKIARELLALTVPQRHQKAIALKTLKMSDAGAHIMGGMTKEEAREFLLSIGYSQRKIDRLEE